MTDEKEKELRLNDLTEDEYVPRTYFDPTIPPRRQPKVKRKSPFLDKYTRKTVYIDIDLLDLIQELASKRKGEQTRIINSALAYYFDGNDKHHPRPDRVDLARKTVYIENSLLDSIKDVTGEHYEIIELIHDALSNYLSKESNVQKHAQSTDWYTKPFWNEIKVGKFHPKE